MAPARKDRVTLTYNNVTKPLAEWAREFNIDQATLRQRLALGQDIETALTSKPKSGHRASYLEVKTAFEKEGYILLSSSYLSSEVALDFVCPNGHNHSIKYSKFKNGQRCGKCAKNAPLVYQDAEQSFESAGYKLVSKNYLNNGTHMDYECPEGHLGSMKLANFKLGHRCPHCSKVAKPTIEQVAKAFEEEGYLLITKEYISNSVKLDYVCPKGHKHSMTWGKFQFNRRCPTCAIEITKDKLKIPFEQVKEEFTSRGWTLITSEYINSRQSLECLCPKGHKTNVYRSAILKGHDCKFCAAINKSGENSPNWNPNLTPEERQKNYSRANSVEGYKDWRKAVFSRDFYKCRLCQTKGELHAHHLYSYTDYPNLRLVVKNGLTLCKSCHDSFHAQYGRGGNTCEQMVEYIKLYTPGGEDERIKAAETGAT